MSCDDELSLPGSPGTSPQGSLTVVTGPCSGRRCVLYLEGSLRVPVDGALRHAVRAHLRRGERIIVLDLARVPSIDAGGIGELVRGYNMAMAANGVLQIVHATTWVRQILQRVGLFAILSAAGKPSIRSCRA